VKYFLASWDSTGFECIQDITDSHPDMWKLTQAQNRLSGLGLTSNPLFQQIELMKMRARANSHRNPEIYVLSAADTVSEEDIRDWSETDPQSLVNWIREKHSNCLWTSRNTEKKVIT